jgi:hypothetical protein
MCPVLSNFNLQSKSSIFSSPNNISKNWNWHVTQQMKLEIKPHPFIIHLDIWFNLSHLAFHLKHCSSSHTRFSHLSSFFSILFLPFISHFTQHILFWLHLHCCKVEVVASEATSLIPTTQRWLITKCTFQHDMMGKALM